MASVRHVGKADLLPDYLGPLARGIRTVTDAPGAGVLSTQLAGAFAEEPDGTPEQVGQMRIFRRASGEGQCRRTILLPERARVYVRAEIVRGAATTLDVCAVFDDSVLASVPGLDTARPEPGLNNWPCEWRGETALRVVPNTDDRQWPSCAVDLYQRGYTTPDGRNLREVLEITVKARRGR